MHVASWLRQRPKVVRSLWKYRDCVAKLWWELVCRLTLAWGHVITSDWTQ